MNEYIIRKFILEKANGSPVRERSLSGRFSGVVGIALNGLLGILKAAAGLTSGSIALVADAVNNLSDSAASVITLIGFRIAGKKGDEKHPFGHARAEYMTGVVISALIIVVGVRTIFMSYEKITHPSELNFSLPTLILILLLIAVKLWLFAFNLRLSRTIDSSLLKATAIDSRNDAIASSVVVLTIFIEHFFEVNIDGFTGLAVGVFILYSGWRLVSETMGPLLGQAPDPALVRDINVLLKSKPGVLGVHDLMVHDYGPNHIFASAHIEVDSKEDIFKSHAMIDDIENEASNFLGIQLVCHMDPIDTGDARVGLLVDLLEKSLPAVAGFKSLHDLRLVSAPGDKVNVVFDAVLEHGSGKDVKREVAERSKRVLADADPAYHPLISFDIDYT
jgi:cation diffusion facilitator family transporter